MDLKKLQDRYTETTLLELQRKITRDERQKILKGLQTEAYAAGVSSKQLSRIANKGVRAAADIWDEIHFSPAGRLQ